MKEYGNNYIKLLYLISSVVNLVCLVSLESKKESKTKQKTVIMMLNKLGNEIVKYLCLTGYGK